MCPFVILILPVPNVTAVLSPDEIVRLSAILERKLLEFPKRSIMLNAGSDEPFNEKFEFDVTSASIRKTLPSSLRKTKASATKLVLAVNRYTISNLLFVLKAEEHVKGIGLSSITPHPLKLI